MRVWIVGRNDTKPWEVVGVFLFRSRADKACVNESYIMGPAKIGQQLNLKAWEGAMMPRKSHG